VCWLLMRCFLKIFTTLVYDGYDGKDDEIEDEEIDS